LPGLLDNQVALVTGGGRGTGRAFCEHLARLGAAVAVHGRREEGPAEFNEAASLSDVARSLAERFSVRTIKLLGDMTVMADVKRVVDAAEKELGPIDVLVHNVGGDIGAGAGKPANNDAVNMAEADIRAVLDRNLLSTVFVCQEVARRMMTRRRGRILTVSSVAAFNGRPHGVIYGVAKAGVAQYTRSLAAQLRPYNINANTLAPGDTRTGRWLSNHVTTEDRLAQDGTLDRVATVDEVGRVVEFFAGPLGAFVSGQVLRVDGGQQVWPA
jgi:3-oxoacyl-[acyl-carrier protein] reductase